MKDIRFACSPTQLATLRAHRQGESDLVFRDGMWFLLATCEIPEKPQFEPVDAQARILERHARQAAVDHRAHAVDGQ